MPITVFYTDLRVHPSKLTKVVVEWQAGLTAFKVLERSLGYSIAKQVKADLDQNSKEVIVSWYNPTTDEICEIGGVGSLDWEVDDTVILTINYENEQTTQEQVDEAIEWSLNNQ